MDEKAYERMVTEVKLENAMMKLLQEKNITLPSTIDEMAKIATELKLDSEQMDVLEAISGLNNDDDISYDDYNNTDLCNEIADKYEDAFGGNGRNYL